MSDHEDFVYHLFSDSSDKGQTVLSPKYAGHVTYSIYRSGYETAANMLVDQLTKSAESPSMGLVMPVMFLYRHFLELTIKDLLAAAKFTGVLPDPQRCGHDLQKLWNEFVRCVEAMGQWPDSVKEWAPFFHEFHELDSKATGFRYVKDKDSNAHWDESFTIDVKHVRFVVKTFSMLCWELENELFAEYEKEERAQFEKEKEPGESLDFIYQY